MTKITPKNARLTRGLFTTLGAAEVLESLKAVTGPSATLPGFALAVAIAEKVVAEHRISLSSTALRAAAKAGVDVGNTASVMTSLEGDEIVLTIEQMDLVEMAEDPSP